MFKSNTCRYEESTVCLDLVHCSDDVLAVRLVFVLAVLNDIKTIIPIRKWHIGCAAQWRAWSLVFNSRRTTLLLSSQIPRTRFHSQLTVLELFVLFNTLKARRELWMDLLIEHGTLCCVFKFLAIIGLTSKFSFTFALGLCRFSDRLRTWNNAFSSLYRITCRVYLFYLAFNRYPCIHSH